MPWLSRRNSSEEVMLKSMNSSSPSPLPSNSSVTFIPAILDGSCGTSPTMQRMSSTQMIVMDIKVMAHNMICFPEMIGSLITVDKMTSVFGSWINLRDICLQMLLCVMEMCMVAMVIPCFLAMPGIAFLTMCCLCAFAISLICWPMNGEQVMRCVAKGQVMDSQVQYADEKWVYINGAMTRYATKNIHRTALMIIVMAKCDRKCCKCLKFSNVQ